MNVEVANKLVQLRKKHGLSQEELAEKISVSRQAVSKWERAESSPDTDNLIALARIYNLSLDDMLSSNEVNERSYNPKDFQEGNVKEGRYRWAKKMPIAIIATLAFLLLGFVWGLWHPGWLVFLMIPIWYTIFS
jgi:transcriptional regulator with XRE-family HTH domain